MADKKNLPINADRRDPYLSKNKGDVGLSKTPNMSYSELQNAILANVISQVNEGTIYNFPRDQKGKIKSNIVKLKPNTSIATVYFSLGTWDGSTEFSGLDSARLDLIVSGDNGSVISYKLQVANNSLGHSKSVSPGDDNDKGLGDVDNYQGHNYVTWNKNGISYNTYLQGTDPSNKKFRGRTPIVGRGWYPIGFPTDKSITNSSDKSKVSTGPKNHKTDSSTPLSNTKIVLKNFNEGGWLVRIECNDNRVDALWINMIECRNIDPQIPTYEQWKDSDFNLANTVSFNCDRSRESDSILFENDIEGLVSYSRSLNHDIKLKLECVDPEDTYNKLQASKGGNHSWSNGDPTTGNDYNSEIVQSFDIKTNEIDCNIPQNIPLTINRLNHPIKFRLRGNSLHKAQESTWLDAWDNTVSGKAKENEYQDNLPSTIDTARGIDNNYPISISGLTHDLDISMGSGIYKGSLPESNSSSNYNTQSHSNPGSEVSDRYKGDYTAAIFNKSGSDNIVNYATISASSSAYDNHYEFDEVTSHNWVMKNNPNGWKPKDKVLSIDTKLSSNDTVIPTSKFNLVIHGIDHDMLIEVVNSNYRKARGIATLSNSSSSSFDFEPDKPYSDSEGGVIQSGINNKTWNTGQESEERRYSYVTGHIKLNTFEKRNFQVLDLVNHGLDHNISFRSYRDNVSDSLRDPSTKEPSSPTNEFRINSNGQDILGDIVLDSFTKRIQRFKLRVIDGRYSDSSRGLAITSEVNKFIPHDQITDNGSYGSKSGTLGESDLRKYYPTINGVPFTGDFRHKVAYTDLAGSHSINNSSGSPVNRSVKNTSLRNIDIFAFHAGDTQSKSGDHRWEVLSTLRKSTTNTSGESVTPSTKLSTRNEVSSLDSGSCEYGIVRLSKFTNKTYTTAPSVPSGKPGESGDKSKMTELLNSLGSDDDVINVKLFKKLVSSLVGLDGEYGYLNNMSGSVPIGTIVPWYDKSWYSSNSGNPLATLPDYLTKNGWVICDGNNGTPNLTGRYIRGFGDGDVKLGAQTSRGDNASGELKDSKWKLIESNIPSHNHTISASLDLEIDFNHYHRIQSYGADCKRAGKGSSRISNIGVNHYHTGKPNRTDNPPYWGGDGAYNAYGFTDMPSSSQSNGTTFSTRKINVKNSNFSSEYVGSGTEFTIEPYYYKLIFIMKIK